MVVGTNCWLLLVDTTTVLGLVSSTSACPSHPVVLFQQLLRAMPSSFCTAMTTDFQLEEGEQGEIYSHGYGVVHEQFVTLSPGTLSYLCCA